MNAVAAGRFRSVQNILEQTDEKELADIDHDAPLIRAVYHEKEDVRAHIIRLLIRYGCDVNQCDKDGRTTLMHACALAGRDDVIRRIISTDLCDVNVVDKQGNTAVMLAVYADNPTAIRILVNSAHTRDVLEPNRENNEGDTPLGVAVDKEMKECALVLVKEGRVNADHLPNLAVLQQWLIEEEERERSLLMKPTFLGEKLSSSVSNSRATLRLEKISLHSQLNLQDDCDPVTAREIQVIPVGTCSPRLITRKPTASIRLSASWDGKYGQKQKVDDGDLSDEYDKHMVGMYSLSPRGQPTQRRSLTPTSPITDDKYRKNKSSSQGYPQLPYSSKHSSQERLPFMDKKRVTTTLAHPDQPVISTLVSAAPVHAARSKGRDNNSKKSLLDKRRSRSRPSSDNEEVYEETMGMDRSGHGNKIASPRSPALPYIRLDS